MGDDYGMDMDAVAPIGWAENLKEILETHQVREPLSSTLLWENPIHSALWFGCGVALYVLVDVFEISIMTVIGSICILQLVIYRAARFLQDKGMAFDDTDLRAKFVLTPSPSAVSKTVQVIGDVIRLIEEGIKNLSLTSDYFRLAQGFSVLLFLSALGRVLSLPVLLLGFWVICFILPFIYSMNQEAIDKALERSVKASELFAQGKKRRSKRD